MCPKPKIEKAPPEPDAPLEAPEDPAEADLNEEAEAQGARRRRGARALLRIQQ